MKVVNTVEELRLLVKEAKKQGKSVGLVPTMGALHKGHLSLIEKCVCENEFSIVSVFVNPTQFGINEDFDKYPRTLEVDSKMCEDAKVDIVFAPSVSEMYKDIKETTLVCPPYSAVDRLCGKSRVGHFDGVATVVSKLFNISLCNRAYFGEKDAQQLFIIQKMVQDLSFDVEIVPCEIVRESDGLAMSSRNVYLTKQGRAYALKLSKALKYMQELVDRGEKDVAVLTDSALAILEGLDVEYFEICDLKSFEEIDTISSNALVLVAANISQGEGAKVRLIDNIKLKIL